ncbi:unnamed protein product [Prorocentrum cordatum]|uniref:PNPLA domain-containing protein n=1 Tax=Prorocentrum cordatum TaxID=2364126 RepID=A0ABN9TTU3_9DINO|nr:unnamed protein product [Polarella glacialis]
MNRMKPKSVRYTRPRALTNTFSGFMSRCIKTGVMLCRNASARKTSVTGTWHELQSPKASSAMPSAMSRSIKGSSSRTCASQPRSTSKAGRMSGAPASARKCWKAISRRHDSERQSSMTSLYLSGTAANYDPCFPLLRRFCGGADHLCLVGGSGGALVAACLSLESSAASVERRFRDVCKSLEAPSEQWEARVAMAETWVRELMGGAACTMRQWSERYRAFHVLLFDCASLVPKLICSDDSRARVAGVLALATARESPSCGLPRQGTWFADVEPFLPAGLLAPHLQPPVLVHFAAGDVRDHEGENTNEPRGAAVLHACYERMLRVPLRVLTWRMGSPDDKERKNKAGRCAYRYSAPRDVHAGEGPRVTIAQYALIRQVVDPVDAEAQESAPAESSAPVLTRGSAPDAHESEDAHAANRAADLQDLDDFLASSSLAEAPGESRERSKRRSLGEWYGGDRNDAARGDEGAEERPVLSRGATAVFAMSRGASRRTSVATEVCGDLEEEHEAEVASTPPTSNCVSPT